MSSICLNGPEVLSAFTLSEVLQLTPRGVRKRLDDLNAPRTTDESGLVAWRSDVLPENWRRRIDLAKRVKGCDTVAELLTCSRRATALFEHRIEQATDYEKKHWPMRKEAVHEYYRVWEVTGSKGEAETRACSYYERRTHMPLSARNLRRWVKVIEKCGGPQHAPDEAYVLWGKRRTLAGPPRETIAYFHELVGQNQRKFAPVWKKLRDQLIAWRETGDPKYRIPGYTTPPPNAKGSDLPLRWSYKYFIDPKRRPSKAVVEGARYGLSAIKALAPNVRKTRVGVKVGEIVYFDDQVYDVKVNVLGINTRGTKPLGLDALDRASDCTFKSFFKPTIWDDEERAKRMLRARDMIWFCVCYLRDVGYRPDTGTTMIVEHGTAALPKWFEDTLRLVTDGKVTVDRGSIGGDPAFPGAFEGPAKGCSNFKAALEGARNPLRNMMADTSIFPGAVGMNRDHSPEDLHGRDRYNQLVIKTAAKLGVDLMYPLIEWRDFPTLALACIESINREIDHRCEGWAESGYTTQEWRFDDNSPWMSRADFQAMPEEKQRMIGAYLEANPHLTRARLLSRREVFDRGAAELVRIPAWAIPQLLTHVDAPDYLWQLRRVNENGEFRFRDEEADPYGGEFSYIARCQDSQGHLVRLIEGQKYKTFLNPLDPRELIVCQPNGAYIGTCPQQDIPAANDATAIAKSIGANRRHVAEACSELAVIGREATRKMEAMRMHNEGAAATARQSGGVDRAKQMDDATAQLASEIYG